VETHLALEVSDVSRGSLDGRRRVLEGEVALRHGWNGKRARRGQCGPSCNEHTHERDRLRERERERGKRSKSRRNWRRPTVRAMGKRSSLTITSPSHRALSSSLDMATNASSSSKGFEYVPLFFTLPSLPPHDTISSLSSWIRFRRVASRTRSATTSSPRPLLASATRSRKQLRPVRPSSAASLEILTKARQASFWEPTRGLLRSVPVPVRREWIV
jgi:hypothetical protein